MKKYGTWGLRFLSVALLFAACVMFRPVTVKAETLASQVSHTITFGEFDQFEIKYNDPVVLKVVIKEKGAFWIDTSPKEYIYVEGTLSDANGKEYKSWNLWSYYTKLFYTELEPGTYYLRTWVTSSSYAGTVTYFGHFEPSSKADIEVCISLKKGKSVQLGTIFTNCHDKKLTWSSSRKSVASVSSKGKVKGLKKGTTEIKVFNSSGIVSKVKVKVTE